MISVAVADVDAVGLGYYDISSCNFSNLFAEMYIFKCTPQFSIKKHILEATGPRNDRKLLDLLLSAYFRCEVFPGTLSHILRIGRRKKYLSLKCLFYQVLQSIFVEYLSEVC